MAAYDTTLISDIRPIPARPKIDFSPPEAKIELPRAAIAGKLNLDLYTGKITLLLIACYVALFGLFQARAFTFGGFRWSYATILLPIWLIDGFKSFFEVFLESHYKYAEEDLSKITVVIACKDGEEVIGQTLNSLINIKRFAPEQVIVVSNGSNDSTCAIARGFGVQCLDVREPLGKVRAINYGLQFVKTPYVLLLDDDTLVDRARIPTELLDNGYAGVAFRVLVKQSTWVTKFQAYEYRKSTDIGKRFHNKRGSVQNISGAIGLFTLGELQRQIKLHSAEFSGEDLQRTLLIYLSDYSKGVVLAHSTVYTLPPTTVGTLFRQRVYGWFPGLYANFPNYVKILFKKKTPRTLRVDAFYNSFFVMLLDVLRLLSLPLLFLNPWYFVMMYASYLILEAATYYYAGMKAPWWVVWFYPLYGLFGFVTRVCAFTVLIYRRLVSRLARAAYYDDYRQASARIKSTSIVAIAFVIGLCLFANDKFDYARVLISYHF